MLVLDGFDQVGRKAPFLHQHGADHRVIHADDLAQGLMQRSAVALADLQGLAEFLGHELGKYHLAEIMQQAGNETVHRVRVIHAGGQLLGDAGGGQRMQQVLLYVETGSIVLGQHADGGNAQGQVLDGVETQVDHRVADRGDLFGQAVVG